MMPATSESEKVRFRTLNRRTTNPVTSHYVDAVTGKAVRSEDEVKGYQTSETDYVMLEDDELENVALESNRTIDIDKFVRRESIDWIWLDTPYYLSVEEPVGQEAFSVIRDAMEAEKMAGIARLVISRRERAVLLEPRGKGIVLWTLRYGDEVRDKNEYFQGIPKAEPDLEPLVDQFIRQETRKWDRSMVADPIRKRLLAMIDIKRKQMKTKIKTTKPQPAPVGAKVVNIMDALRKSVEKDKKGERGLN
jgi:DNA end-binding protein Ku